MQTTPPGIFFNDLPPKNDLKGSLEGSVWLAQGTVLPSPASALAGDVQPRLVSLRTALVLFKPISVLQDNAVCVHVLDGNGAILYSSDLNAPSALPPVAAGGVSSGGVGIAYGKDFWSTTVPWNHVLPGMTLRFQSGKLIGSHERIAVGAPGELLLHTVDIGMLAPNRNVFSSSFSSEDQRQYFQQIPCSRLLVNQYEAVHWTEIMLPDGTLYTDRSSAKADVHEGDLRQRIGKELISLGINNANYGIHSSPGKGESGLNKVYAVAQLTAHTSVGNYTQGVVNHGMSGGGSIVTLLACRGNEFSHELGHNFGLDHYPAGFKGSVHRPAGCINSTWGWDSERNVFLPNFKQAEGGEEACYKLECQAPFHGHAFGHDAMAGGKPYAAAANGYTLHTPWVLDTIQRFFESKAVFSSASATGYLKWNEATASMEEWAEFHYAEPAEVNLQSMTALVARYRLVEVSMYNGHFTSHTYIPPANAGNKGHGVQVVHQASWDNTLHVNDGTVTLKDGDVLRYESNGKQWLQVPDFSFNVVRKPAQHGVPVTTLLGYYDPAGSLPDYLYPALHGAYGHVAAADRQVEAQVGKCHLQVKNAKGQVQRYVLRATRADASVMNAFHINVAQAFAPTTITLFREGEAVLSRDLLRPAGGTRFGTYGQQ